jgi:predicted nucleic-acid-binding protein
MPTLDANCLLRWLLGDIPEQTALVADLINSGESFTVADAALIETVFVLEKVKKISRETIEKALMALIGNNAILCNRELFIEILPILCRTSQTLFC